MSRQLLTTGQAARKAGITRQTLQNWIRAKKIKPPAPTLDGARGKRIWSEADLARLRKAKAEIYYKGQGRPRKAQKERAR